MRRALAASGLGLVMVLAGCGASPLERAADRGDFASLRGGIAARERLGSLGDGEAAAIAERVATWEIVRGADQRERVRDVRTCARELDGALASRMKTRDAAGAEAALARLEAGEMSAGDARDHAADADDAWRAVGARGLVREDDQVARVKAYVDPAPGVRRAAMHAAILAHDARDVGALAESARLDPEPIVRTDAVRALGAIGGAPVVAALRDLWAAADGSLKEDVAVAFAAPASWTAGGREELRMIVAAEHGPAAIEAAGAVLRGPNRDAEIEASAGALMARTIQRASHRDRLHALVLAPLAPAYLLDAVRAASQDLDVTVRVAALSRLLESAKDRAAAVAALEAIAGDPARSPAASRAKLALAGAGDLRVQAWLEADLGAFSPPERLSAASALAELGRPARAAPLLADADPAVRARAACTILLGNRGRHAPRPAAN